MADIISNMEGDENVKLEITQRTEGTEYDINKQALFFDDQQYNIEKVERTDCLKKVECINVGYNKVEQYAHLRYLVDNKSLLYVKLDEDTEDEYKERIDKLQDDYIPMTGETFSMSNGFNDFDKVKYWIENRVNKDSIVGHLMFDWDNTISLFDGFGMDSFVAFFGTTVGFEGKEDYIQKKYDDLLYNFNKFLVSPDRYGSFLTIGRLANANNVKIHIVTNNGIADKDDQEPYNIFHNMVEMLFNVKDITLVYTGMGSNYGGDKSKYIIDEVLNNNSTQQHGGKRLKISKKRNKRNKRKTRKTRKTRKRKGKSNNSAKKNKRR
jgi:hypothetical protein